MIKKRITKPAPTSTMHYFGEGSKGSISKPQLEKLKEEFLKEFGTAHSYGNYIVSPRRSHGKTVRFVRRWREALRSPGHWLIYYRTFRLDRGRRYSLYHAWRIVRGKSFSDGKAGRLNWRMWPSFISHLRYFLSYYCIRRKVGGRRASALAAWHWVWVAVEYQKGLPER